MSIQIDGAVIKEQGITFAIVAVKAHVIESMDEAQKARKAFSHVFPGMPIILLSRDSQGRSTLNGKTAIVNFLSKTDPWRVPWRRYIIA